MNDRSRRIHSWPLSPQQGKPRYGCTHPLTASILFWYISTFLNIVATVSKLHLTQVLVSRSASNKPNLFVYFKHFMVIGDGQSSGHVKMEIKKGVNEMLGSLDLEEIIIFNRYCLLQYIIHHHVCSSLSTLRIHPLLNKKCTEVLLIRQHPFQQGFVKLQMAGGL